MTSVVIILSQLTSASISLCFGHVSAVELKRTDTAGKQQDVERDDEGYWQRGMTREGDDGQQPTGGDVQR